MTPLEAVRQIRMVAQPARNQNTGQAACCGTPPTAPHVPGCAWLSWDQIITALEAAEAYLAPGTEGGGSLARLQALEAAITAGQS